MQTISLQTRIDAPPLRVFLLSLNVDLHRASAARTAEQVVGGVTQGTLVPGDSVTFRGRHFGLWLTQTSRITRYDAPAMFADEMTRGLFRSFIHTHTFAPTAGGGTLMCDALEFASPLGWLGAAVDRLVLRRTCGAFSRRAIG